MPQPQLGEHLPAVHARQHHVQNQQIVPALQRQMQPFLAVMRQIHGKARLPQALAQVLASLDLVFDNQNLHRHFLSTADSLPLPACHCVR
ncbi:hypothetical protein D3C72_1493010 [compost metagenome]